MIAHPPCTYLCNSGWHWTERALDQGDDSRLILAQKAASFFQVLQEAPIPKICIENPQPAGWTMLKVGRYDQAIQPYMFGDDASKRTCLWLKGLEPLSVPPEDTWVQPRIVNGLKRWSNQTDSGQNKLGPSETRALERSRTYEGIGHAFASNWG